MAKVKRRIKLACTQCKRTNYFPNKSRALKERLVMSKFCRHCRAHTEHKENK